MTAHACTTFDPHCYRCDLGRDEVEATMREIAGEYWDAEQAPLLSASGVYPDALAVLRKGYIRDALRNDEARAQLLDWDEARD